MTGQENGKVRFYLEDRNIRGTVSFELRLEDAKKMPAICGESIYCLVKCNEMLRV